MAYRILMVEDEKKMQDIVRDYFAAKGSRLICANNGTEALELLSRQTFDLVLLDIMMPILDGFSVCREIRRGSEVPVVFLTAKNDEDDKLYGYELGADDYVTKPFSLAVLYAKCAALIKRTDGGGISEMLQAGEITVYPKSRQVEICGRQIRLANLEYELLLYFIRHKNCIVTRNQLLYQLWGYDFAGEDRVIDTHVKKLRKAMGECAGYIKTVIKMGYRFEIEEREKENEGTKRNRGQ